MQSKTRIVTTVGELVERSFEEAARCSADPLVVSRAAVLAVLRMLHEARTISPRPFLVTGVPARC